MSFIYNNLFLNIRLMRESADSDAKRRKREQRGLELERERVAERRERERVAQKQESTASSMAIIPRTIEPEVATDDSISET
jgi:hypothetical protein